MSRIRSSLVVALCLVWVVALACAAADPLPAMQCQRGHMPCCPATGHGDAHCSAVRCEPQIFQKSEAPQVTGPQVRGAAVRLPAVLLITAKQRELVSGLRPSFSVFRLKDDLRI